MDHRTRAANQVALQHFLQQESERFRQRIGIVLQDVHAAQDIHDLVRAVSSAAVAAPATVRSLHHGGPEHTNVRLAAETRGRAIIDVALQHLGEFRRCPQHQYKQQQGQFIEHFREPCRGHFPALYNHADNGIRELATWRHRHLKDETDMVSRPERGEDLLALGYVFRQVGRAGLNGIRKHGLSADGFLPEPTGDGEGVWLAVHPSQLPGEAGKLVPADLLVVCDRHAHVQGDGTLHAGVSAVRSGFPRPR